MLYLYLSQLRGDLFQQWRCPQEKLVTEAPPPNILKYDKEPLYALNAGEWVTCSRLHWR